MRVKLTLSTNVLMIQSYVLLSLKVTLDKAFISTHTAALAERFSMRTMFFFSLNTLKDGAKLVKIKLLSMLGNKR